MPDSNIPGEAGAGEQPVDETALTGEATAGRPRDRLVQVITEGKEKLSLRWKEKVKTEVKEWREGPFKEKMRLIVQAQQEICGQDQNEEACANGREIYKQMFNEEWIAEAPAEGSAS